MKFASRVLKGVVPQYEMAVKIYNEETHQSCRQIRRDAESLVSLTVEEKEVIRMALGIIPANQLD